MNSWVEAEVSSRTGPGKMRRTVFVLLALPAMVSAFLQVGPNAPALQNAPRSALSHRRSGLHLARGAGRAATLQASGVRMVQDSGNAVHYAPYLGLEERDACGVGFIANRNGERNHDIIRKVV